jgi:hypothetical protein
MAEDILKEAREAFQDCVDAEAVNRADALDDLRFARLAEQWPDAVRRQRELEARPCLTINRLPAFIRQVVNDARQNKPSIKVHPVDDDADPETAKIINGLIRNIEYASNADVAYDTAAESAVTNGFGYFRIGVEYAHDDSFDKDLVIQRVANPFSIYGDPCSTAADSADWNVAFATEWMKKAAFQRRFPGAGVVDWDRSGYGDKPELWLSEDSVMVAEYWRREEVEREILLLSGRPAYHDGTMGSRIVAADHYARHKAFFDGQGLTVQASRKARSHKVTQRLMTGAEVIETNDWAGRYIPIIPVYGDEVNVEGRRYFRSLVRDAKDPQSMFNYWRSASTELVALAPKAPFIGPKGAFETDRAKWQTANSQSHACIEYDVVPGMTGPPQRQPFAGVPAGALQEALNASDDMKAIMGLHDAALGAPGNETSGRAILARQRDGDVSTFHFIDNLTRAIRHAGRVLIDLIPAVYTGERVIRVLGIDGRPENARIGPLGRAGPAPSSAPPLPSLPDTPPESRAADRIYDLSIGKYDLTVAAGPSYSTKRQEAAESMVELIRAYPPAAPLLGDLLARNMDWPEADEVAKRLRTMLPPQMQGEDPRLQQMEQLVQQGQAVIGQLQARIGQLETDKSLDLEKLRLETESTRIKAYEAETRRLEAMAKFAPPAVAARTVADIVNSPDILPGGPPPMAPPQTMPATARIEGDIGHG